MAEISTLIQRFLNVKVSRIINSSSPGRQLHSRTDIEKHRLDVHQHREMLYVFEGESDFLYRDSIWRLTPGTLVAIDEMEPHSYGYSKDDDGLLHLWIHQHSSTITASCLEVKNGAVFHSGFMGNIPHSASAYLLHRWNSLFANSFEDEIFLSLAANFVQTLMCEYAMRMLKQNMGENEIQSELVEFVEAFIERNHGRDCSLARLEKVTGYSRFYLSHLFKRLRNITIGEAVDAARIRYLEDVSPQGLKQQVLAEALGFSSLASFCIWKKRKMSNKWI